MVALSLYRGNLHRVPDVPRRWSMPPPAISLRHFRILIRKRALALSHLVGPVTTTPAGTLDAKEEGKGRQEPISDNVAAKPDSLKVEIASNLNAQTPDSGQKKGGDTEEGKPLQESEGNRAPASNLAVSAAAMSEDVRDSAVRGGVAAGTKLEASNKLNTAGNKGERKIELEKKLQVLNEKKHHLVQMLKQILNAEEEIKRRNMQPFVVHGSIPLQAEIAADMGSVTRQAPKISVDVNFNCDLGGESDLVGNHITPARQLHHLHSTSPLTASFSRTSFGSQQHNTVHTPRSSLAGVGIGQTTSDAALMASPSRFAPTTGHQVPAVSVPPVALPGTNYLSSSPSPATSSGASSFFRDSRINHS